MLQMMMFSITRETMKFPPLAILCPCSLLFGYVFVELHDIPVLSEAQHFITIVSNHIFDLCHIIQIWGATSSGINLCLCAVPFSLFNLFIVERSLGISESLGVKSDGVIEDSGVVGKFVHIQGLVIVGISSIELYQED